ncbi:ribosome recycling factor [Acetivibrio sp. MSJd-27]|jgi:ribosome recycling factor|uniref:ribosome recycling factor n=1 Tax=Acetivibrio sp. MSJd-27 TaxID=2841523 RepID=UPI0015B0B349|nr:ribosome recycling factor [Acetivibrio sp. MSJd-27]MBU5449274.1 ribosome recycling factor [Acetivibrio sp. MSJd-27]
MQEILKDVEIKMGKTVDILAKDFAAVRAGRANPAILDKVTVDYYGTATPIAQVGNISIPDARTILIQPWDASILGDVEKAIQKADLGINPNNDGKCIRLSIPALTEERRKELVKDIHKIAESARVSIRNIRRDGVDKLKDMKKKSEITEDDLKDAEGKVQKSTDKYVKEVDTLLAAKEKEILTV